MSLVTNGLGAASAPRNLVLNGFNSRIVAEPVVTRRLTVFGTSKKTALVAGVSRQKLSIRGAR